MMTQSLLYTSIRSGDFRLESGSGAQAPVLARHIALWQHNELLHSQS